MVSSIVLVGLDHPFVKEVAIALSNELDMFFLDAQDLIDYSLMDSKKIELVCGIKYLEKEQKKLVQGLTSYENTVISLPHSYYIKNQTAKFYKNKLLVIYLQLTKDALKKQNVNNANHTKLDVEILAYEELNELLCKNCDIVVNNLVYNTTACVCDILNELKKIKQ